MSRLGHPHGQHQHSQQQPRLRPGQDRHAEAVEGLAPAWCSGEALRTRAGCGKRGLPGARVVLGTRLSHRYFLLGAVIGCQRNNRLAIPGAGPPQNEEPAASCRRELPGARLGRGEALSQVFPAGRCDCLPCLSVSGPPPLHSWSSCLRGALAGPSPGLLAAPSLPRGPGALPPAALSRGSRQAGGPGAEGAPGRGPSWTFLLRACTGPPHPGPLPGFHPGSGS